MKNISFILVIVWALLLGSGCREQSPPPPSPATGQGAVQGAPLDAPVSPTPQADARFTPRVAPTDPSERAALAAEAPKPVEKEGYQSVGFGELSGFSYLTNDDGALLPDQEIPEKIRSLNHQNVAVSGYLVPIEYDGEKVSGLILVRNQLLCCFGEEPKLNEWILVGVEPPVEATLDVPVTFFGKFEVSPDIEEGQVISLYRLSATAMETMKQ